MEFVTGQISSFEVITTTLIQSHSSLLLIVVQGKHRHFWFDLRETPDIKYKSLV